LLRQKCVEPHWKKRKRRDGKKGHKKNLEWQPHTSRVLRVMLETRHLPNVPSMVEWAVTLGSEHSLLPEQPADLRLPVKQSCDLHVCSDATASHGLATEETDSHHQQVMDAASVSLFPGLTGFSESAVDNDFYSTGMLTQSSKVYTPGIPDADAYSLHHQALISYGPASNPPYLSDYGSAPWTGPQPGLQWFQSSGYSTGLPSQPPPAWSLLPYPTESATLHVAFQLQDRSSTSAHHALTLPQQAAGRQANVETGEYPNALHTEHWDGSMSGSMPISIDRYSTRSS
jgi:hypothetical protein